MAAPARELLRRPATARRAMNHTRQPDGAPLRDGLGRERLAAAGGPGGPDPIGRLPRRVFEGTGENGIDPEAGGAGLRCTVAMQGCPLRKATRVVSGGAPSRSADRLRSVEPALTRSPIVKNKEGISTDIPWSLWARLLWSLGARLGFFPWSLWAHTNR